MGRQPAPTNTDSILMRELLIDGTTYRLASPTDGAIQKKLLQLAKAAEPNPLNDMIQAVKGLAPEVQTELLKDAMARTYDKRVLTMEEKVLQLQDYVSSPAGLEQFLLMLWQRHQPALTPDQVFDLHGKAVEQYGDAYFEAKSA